MREVGRGRGGESHQTDERRTFDRSSEPGVKRNKEPCLSTEKRKNNKPGDWRVKEAARIFAFLNKSGRGNLDRYAKNLAKRWRGSANVYQTCKVVQSKSLGGKEGQKRTISAINFWWR